MGWSVEVNKDSINETGQRITTFVACYPRMIHSEIMTHRVVAKSAASSRAIPIQKMIAQVKNDPAGPVWWGKNQSGMQAEEELTGTRRRVVSFLWYKARWLAILSAWVLWKVGLHKQIANRILEPWMWMTVITTATDWSNLFALRCHPAAQPEFQHLARMLRKAYAESTPRRLKNCEWHLPYVRDAEISEFGTYNDEGAWQPDWAKLCAISVGRSCRVSYLTHDGKRDIQADLDLTKRITSVGHNGALDHCAQACYGTERHGHLTGWKPYRKTFDTESDFGIASAIEKVKAHPSIDAKKTSQMAFWVSKRPFHGCAGFSLLTNEPLTATRIGLGSGELPDYFHVILVADPTLDAARLDVSSPSYGNAVRAFLVPVAGLPVDMEPAVYAFTGRTDFCGYRRVGGA